MGAAALVFLAVYAIYLPFMTFVIIRKGIKTIYGFLWFFVLIRFASQLCGVVYAKLGSAHWQWLISYLILGSVGYYALILTAFHTTCKAQKFQFGSSPIVEIVPFKHLESIPVVGKIIGNKSWAALFKLVLTPANILVIIGGTDIADVVGESAQNQASSIQESKILRGVGLSMFLAFMVVAVVVNLCVFWLQNVRNTYTRMAALAGPFLLVRGIFGVLSIYVTEMNYFSVTTLNTGEISWQSVVYEYVLGVCMELFGSIFLVATWKVETPLPFDTERSYRYKHEESE